MGIWHPVDDVPPHFRGEQKARRVFEPDHGLCISVRLNRLCEVSGSTGHVVLPGKEGRNLLPLHRPGGVMDDV